MNQVILIGRLGKDPEMGEKGEFKWANFSLATNDRSGKEELTNWHNVTVFEKTAENCAKYLSKGSLCAVTGSIRYEQYEKDGQTKYMTKIIGNRVEFLDSKPKGTGADF